MSDDRTVFLLFFTVSGLLLIGLAVPLLRGKIPPNGLYGFRVPKTINNSQVWYAANQYAAKRLLWAGASFVAAAMLLYWLPGLSLDFYALGCLVIFLVVLIWGLIQDFIYLGKL